MDNETVIESTEAIGEDAEVTAENLVHFLEEDANFVDFFNCFLSLPTFAQRLFYNTASHSFEEFDQHLAEDVWRKSERNSANIQRKGIPKGDSMEHRARIGYYVKFLNKQEGFEWVQENRLPSFLKSDLYAEFKLSRHLADAETKHLETLVRDTIFSELRSNSFRVSRSNRKFSLYPGLKAFQENVGIEEPIRRVSTASSFTFSENQSETEEYIARRRLSTLRTAFDNRIDEDDIFYEGSINGNDDDNGSVFNEDTIPYHKEELTGANEQGTNFVREQDMAYNKNVASLTDDKGGNIGGKVTAKDTLNEVMKDDLRFRHHRKRCSSLVSAMTKDSTSMLEPSKRLLSRRATITEGNLNVTIPIEQLKESFIAKKATLKKRQTLLSLFTDGREDSDDDESVNGVEKTIVNKVEEPTPLDLGTKAGLEAFKYFLVGSSGEKLFALWIEIERLKYLVGSERSRKLKNVKAMFLSSGANYEFSGSMKLDLSRALSSENVGECLPQFQEKSLSPLLDYWCPRFLLHNKINHRSRIKDYLSSNHNCKDSQCSFHSVELRDLPQRPVTCIPHYRTQAQAKDHDRMVRSPQVCEKSKTVQKLRSKSAHPRIISTGQLKETNLGYLQLMLLTVPPENDAGFLPPKRFSYHNNAAEFDLDYRRNVRLYIQPSAPSDAKYSVVKRVDNEKTYEASATSISSEYTLSLLAEALLMEKNSGEHFLHYINESGNKKWMDCYMFWNGLREFTEGFFAENFRQQDVQHKAGILYANYIVKGSSSCIGCSDEIEAQIYKALNPAYEDLFDEAEEHALNVLVSPWREMLKHELEKFEKLRKEQKLKYIEVRGKGKKDSMKKEEEYDDEEAEEDDEREMISLEEIGLPLPVPKDGVTFDTIMRDKEDKEQFLNFLQKRDRKALNDYLAWLEMEAFRRLPSKTSKKARDIKATAIGAKWLGKEYFFGPNSPATKDGQEEVRKYSREKNGYIPARPPSPVITEAQRFIRARLERRWLLLYKETREYITRRKAKSSISDMVEDMMMKRRLQRSEAAWKILNSRWISGSRDVVALRQTLLDTEKCRQFTNFLALKGDLMENNINFWLDVQKFKELCHCHLDSFAVSRKIQTIVEVFIKSSIPPELQIDVPIEIAERLYEKAAGKMPQHGPYLFREAQTTVFRILFNYWKEFVTFRASISEDKLAQHLEELVKKHRAEKKAKAMASERRRLARLAAEKRKKDKEDKGRHRLFSDYASTRTFDDDDELEVMTFSYAKLIADDELQELEQRMRENGYTIDELTEGVGISKRGSSDDMRSLRSGSVVGPTRSGRGYPHSQKNTRKTLSVKNDVILEDPSEESLSRLTSIETKDMPLQHQLKAPLNPHFAVKSRSGKSRKTPKHLDEAASTVTESIADQLVRKRGKNISKMPGPRRDSSVGGALTMESLKEFDKSRAGNSLDSSLPQILISETREQPDVDCPRSSPLEKERLQRSEMSKTSRPAKFAKDLKRKQHPIRTWNGSVSKSPLEHQVTGVVVS